MTGLGHLGNWMKLQVTAPLGGNSRIQNQEISRRLDWIQSTGLKAQNQEETPVFENPGDWIRANSVSMKAHLCFKALQIQDPLDSICLGSEIRIREED